MLHQAGSRPVILGSVLLCILAACDGASKSRTGNGDRVAPGGSPPATPTLQVTFSARQMHFSWNGVSDATWYRIFRNPDGASGFRQIDGDLGAASHSHDIALHPLNRTVARYFLQACNTAGCTASNEVDTLGVVLRSIGYFKASNTETHGSSAISLALSRDGNTLAVGAPGESSGAASSGAVYVFARHGGAWSQQAYVKASRPSPGDSFGNSLSLSSDGDTLAVGVYLEDSLASGIDGDHGGIAENNSNRGAVYVYARNGGNWSQQAYVKASSSHDNAYFGADVALDSDGNTLAVGATGERTGALDAGAVYVFTRNSGAWSQQALVKASSIQTNARFGSAVALNGDGNLLAVGSVGDSSAATGDGDQTGSAGDSSGAVSYFVRSGGAWSQQSHVKASDAGADDGFGRFPASGNNGNTLALEAPGESSGATGIGGNQTDNNAIGAGAAYPY